MNKIWNSLGIAVLGIALLVGAATADTSGTTDIDADVENIYAITAPGAITGWSLNTIGVNSYDSSAHSVTLGTVSSNSAWKVQVSEVGGDGQMASAAASTDKLAAIHASSDAFVASDVTMSATAQNIATGTATASTNLDIDYKQTIAYTDVVHGDYAIQLTYAVSSNP